MDELNLSSLQLDCIPELSHRAYKKLNASRNLIRILWDEDMPAGVEELNLEMNYILEDGLLTNLPGTLTHLNLSRNPLRSLREIQNWGNLRCLNVSHTGIYDTLCPLPDTLEELNISHTAISHISRLPVNLKSLHADSTSLRMLPWRCPTGLETLVASRGKLRNGGLPHFWGLSLKTLDLNCNYLTEIPRNLPESLQLLNLSYNSIVYINREVPKSVGTLHVGKNRILEEPKWLSRRGLVYTIHKNHLTEIPRHPNCLSNFGQWVGGKFLDSSVKIQRSWRRSRLRQPLRTWRRISKIKEDLIALAMIPERAGRFESISNYFAPPQPQSPPRS